MMKDAIRYDRDQLRSWLAGIPRHDWVNGRHVPDFSCCKRGLLAPPEERELFYCMYRTGESGTVLRLELMFLGRSLHRFRGEPDERI